MSSGSQSKLIKQTKEIRLKWEATRDAWRDRKASEFDQDYMASLAEEAARAAAVIEEVDKVLRKIRKDCE